jgi:transposase
MRWVGFVARIWEKRNVYRLLVGKPEGKRPQGRPRRRWVDNIKMNILDIGLDGVDWIGLAQDRYRWRVLVNGFHKMLGTTEWLYILWPFEWYLDPQG